MRIGGSVRTVTPATGDDLPVFDEAPNRAVDFAPREIRPPGRRGPVVAGTWGLGLVAIVGVGLLAGTPVSTPAPRSALDAPSSEPETHGPPQRLAVAAGGIVDLESPAPARVEITTPTVDVLGSMLVRAARVEIALEARGNRILDHASIDVSNRDGGIRPERGPSFQASFDLPFPRPNGTMWVVVTAYDDGGMPLGSTRRPFEVGPLLEPVVALADSNPMAERWRPQPSHPGYLLAEPPPTCLPLSPTLASSC